MKLLIHNINQIDIESNNKCQFFILKSKVRIIV